MKKKKDNGIFGKLLSFLAWLTGVIVSLAVAFGMIDGKLTVMWIPVWVTTFFGWVVVITTLLGVLLAIIHHVNK